MAASLRATIQSIMWDFHLRNSNFNDRKGVSSSPSLVSPRKIDHLPSLKRTERRHIPETLLN
jgi:hypothetical protein